ncbi:MAG TPA: ArsR family transcriptional regulator [Methylomirabilota bacterium]
MAEGRALLVCAYEDESKCQRMRLDGALTLRELQERLATLPRSQEIIFYCA